MTSRGWTLLRAAGLVIAVVVLSPLSPLVLVFLPLAVMLLAFRRRDVLALAMAVVIFGLVFAGGGERADALWLAERGWALLLAGGFVVATVFWEEKGVLFRSMAALAGSGGVLLVSSLVRPSLLARMDWWMGRELSQVAGLAGEALRGLTGGEGILSADLDAMLYRVLEWQLAIYPALLALASLAALGVGWFILSRFRNRTEGLGPLRCFRFSDHLVWIVIGGMTLFLLPVGEVAARIGENALFFMGGLYLLRGIGVVLFIGAATVSSIWSAAIWTLLALLVYPLFLGAALVLGLGDTWLDFRGRFERLRGSERR